MSNEILDNLEIEENRFADSRDLDKLKVLRIIAVVQFITSIIATCLEFVTTETIIGTGPLGSILGIFLFFRARGISPYIGKEWTGKFFSFRIVAMIVGLSAPFFSLFWFLMIVTFDLSPNEAHEPVFMGLCAYTVFLFFMTFLLFGSYRFREYN